MNGLSKYDYLSIAALLIALSVGLLYAREHRWKKGFVLNQKIFEGFKGTQELQTKLKSLQQKDKRYLDSLFATRDIEKNPTVLAKYTKIRQKLIADEEQLSTQYTAELWSRINRYVSAYGKEKHYEFIFGASGNGNLMYARETHEITEDLIHYMNEKYGEK